MRRNGILIAALAIGLTAVAGRAGVYDLDDPPPRQPILQNTLERIRFVIDPLRLAQNYPVLDQPLDGVKQLAGVLEAKPAKQMLPPDYVTLAACYFRLGRRDDAEKALRQADSSGYLVGLVARRDRLEAKPPGERTTADSINLGASYIRLGRYSDAVQVLSAADQRHFLVLTNLAAAYKGMNEWERAVGYEEQALAAWPSSQPGWDRSELYWYHRAETYFLKMLRLRLRESLVNPAVKRWDSMDALFDKPHSPAAPYEPHMPTWRMWGDLPPDGYNIVAQLLIWSPTDDRLYWQLGELLNAAGGVRDAYGVFDELVYTRSESAVRELQEHRSILKDALPAVDALNQARADEATFLTGLHTVGCGLSLHGPLAPPVCGDLADAAALAAWLPAANALNEEQRVRYRQQLQEELQKLGQPSPNPPAQTQTQTQAASSTPSAAVWPDWRPLVVGFGAGLIVAVLAALQWTEWRRRRQAAQTADPAPPAPLPPQRMEPAVHDAGAIRTDASPSPTNPHRMEGAP